MANITTPQPESTMQDPGPAQNSQNSPSALEARLRKTWEEKKDLNALAMELFQSAPRPTEREAMQALHFLTGINALRAVDRYAGYKQGWMGAILALGLTPDRPIASAPNPFREKAAPSREGLTLNGLAQEEITDAFGALSAMVWQVAWEVLEGAVDATNWQRARARGMLKADEMLKEALNPILDAYFSDSKRKAA